ncbi:hypothetical protein GLOIN_2v1716816 [Rhizophagus irregularis DAOM 181602=DAOM 197198]|uniref:Uncharacterized protein n=1 Tax=Rhizophagus irregularis (strain DAOM 181602 / DAOM 197198 / MUCL 43194) TaxID=747089 RepID=A0A2P4P3U5_RHIID|nr:hypothetical protein GLOIN_2v1716816 [Rhizophagus irregularis DAOM 181602=DAOM 197198]POG60061.1 hypothetical protein GLOIN_2v1716816 [Rhizophagus irregularis DAOM 181602=DAOM 197198]GET51034.1 hypothetical protein GLOIN_2v1716816 [Rhizophagus irregularis DAOM 181602=DAOM 197198]|eukprot:XP_025166927.1 hypothetical protein GLOIN_2v1716816 [Rhizophagus irregularis DAOM 181602=DAOM 197198]
MYLLTIVVTLLHLHLTYLRIYILCFYISTFLYFMRLHFYILCSFYAHFYIFTPFLLKFMCYLSEQSVFIRLTNISYQQL